MNGEFAVGEKVKISPVGAGVFTDITDAGYPRVNHIAVTWMVMEDGRIYNPLNRPIPEYVSVVVVSTNLINKIVFKDRK